LNMPFRDEWQEWLNWMKCCHLLVVVVVAAVVVIFVIVIIVVSNVIVVVVAIVVLRVWVEHAVEGRVAGVVELDGVCGCSRVLPTPEGGR
jgi:hypothetical protein